MAQTTTEKMSLTGAIFMNINLMVGASAFMAPQMMAGCAGYASFYGWFFAGALFFPIVWCIAQATRLFPGKGSFYSYSKNCISRTAGFVSGWMYFLGYVSIGSTQLMNLADIIGRQFGVAFCYHHPLICSVALLAGLTLLSWRALSAIDAIQSYATLFKLTPLLIAIGSLLIYFSPSDMPSIFSSSPLALLPTVPLAIFGFWGFEGACNISHLIEDSEKNAPRAVMIGFFLTVSIYSLFHLGLLSLMGAQGLSQQGVAPFINFLGIQNEAVLKLLSSLVSSAIIVAHINAIFGGIIANSTMLCAMAEEKLLFMSSTLSSRVEGSNRPFGATLAHILGMIFCITILSNKGVLNAMSNLGVLFAFFMTIIALLSIQLKRRSAQGQVVSLLGLGSCIFLSYQSWLSIGATTCERVSTASPLIIVMLLGYIMFLHTQRQNRNA